MEVIVDRCAGLDVHKKTVVAYVRIPGSGRQKRQCFPASVRRRAR